MRDSDDYARYRELTDGNKVYLGQVELCFYIYIDPGAVIRPLYQGQGDRINDRSVSRAYTRTVEAQLSEAIARPDISVAVEPWGGPKVGGPIPDQTYAIQLLGFAFETMTTIVLLVDFADIVMRAISKAKQLSEKDVRVSNGDALLLASRRVFDATHERDLTVAFVAPMNRYLVGLDEMGSPADGWLVGFRSPEKLYMAHVTVHGEVTLTGSEVSIEWKSEA